MPSACTCSAKIDLSETAKYGGKGRLTAEFKLACKSTLTLGHMPDEFAVEYLGFVDPDRAGQSVVLRHATGRRVCNTAGVVRHAVLTLRLL
jgi:hypothetical protein